MKHGILNENLKFFEIEITSLNNVLLKRAALVGEKKKTHQTYINVKISFCEFKRIEKSYGGCESNMARGAGPLHAMYNSSKYLVRLRDEYIPVDILANVPNSFQRSFFHHFSAVRICHIVNKNWYQVAPLSNRKFCHSYISNALRGGARSMIFSTKSSEDLKIG